MEIEAIHIKPHYHAVVITGHLYPVDDTFVIRNRVVIECGKLTLFRKPKDLVSVTIIGGDDNDPSSLQQPSAASRNTESAHSSWAARTVGRSPVSSG